MEKCVYKGKVIYAINVKEKGVNYDFEIKEAGKNGLLKCCGCEQEVIYKKGDIVIPYFAHKPGNDRYCDFYEFTKFCNRMSSEWKELKQKIYNHFKENCLNYEVVQNARITPKHWSDISLTYKDGKNIIIEIDDKNIKAKKMNSIMYEYDENNIDVYWIVVDQMLYSNIKEEDLSVAKRFQINNSKENKLIIVDKYDLSKFALYKFNNNYNDLFCYKFSLDQMIIKNDKLIIDGFDEEYNKWLDNKENEKIEQKKLKIKKEEEYNKRIIDLLENTYWDKKKYLKFCDEGIINGNRFSKDCLIEKLKLNCEIRDINILKDINFYYLRHFNKECSEKLKEFFITHGYSHVFEDDKQISVEFSSAPIITISFYNNERYYKTIEAIKSDVILEDLKNGINKDIRKIVDISYCDYFNDYYIKIKFIDFFITGFTKRENYNDFRGFLRGYKIVEQIYIKFININKNSNKVIDQFSLITYNLRQGKKLLYNY